MGVAVSPEVIPRRQLEIFAPKTWEPRQQAAAAAVELYLQLAGIVVSVLTLSNVSLRFGGGKSSVILDRGSGLSTEDNVRSMTWG